MLSQIKRSGLQDSAVFVVALDNDRAIEHPAHEAKPHSSKKDCRYCSLLSAINEVLDYNHGGLPNERCQRRCELREDAAGVYCVTQ